MNSYIGIDGAAKKITDIYIGVDNVSKKVLKGYVGVDGVAKLFWAGSIPFPDFLIDFNGYVEGTEENPIYVLTSWKGTLNGEASTEIVIPDRNDIIL